MSQQTQLRNCIASVFPQTLTSNEDCYQDQAVGAPGTTDPIIIISSQFLYTYCYSCILQVLTLSLVLASILIIILYNLAGAESCISICINIKCSKIFHINHKQCNNAENEKQKASNHFQTCLFEFEPFYEDGLVTVQRVVLSITFSGHEI